MKQPSTEPPPLPPNLPDIKTVAETDEDEIINPLILLGGIPFIVLMGLAIVLWFAFRPTPTGLGSGDGGSLGGDKVTEMGVAGEQQPTGTPSKQEVTDVSGQAESSQETAGGAATSDKRNSGEGYAADAEGEEIKPVEEVVIGLPSGKVASGAVSLKLGDAFNPFLESASGDEIVYVIDTSGSMDGDRYQRVAAELIEAIHSLKATQKFNIILFSTGATLFHQDSLVAATKETKAAAGQWLKRQYCGGGTDPTQALEFAIRMRAKKIVVLSDGEFDGLIPAYVTAFNQSLQATIDCIGFDPQSATLKELAAQNGPGRFYAVR